MKKFRVSFIVKDRGGYLPPDSKKTYWTLKETREEMKEFILEESARRYTNDIKITQIKVEEARDEM